MEVAPVKGILLLLYEGSPSCLELGLLEIRCTVDPLVFDEMRSLAEAFAAGAADVGPFPSVDPPVSFEE